MPLPEPDMPPIPTAGSIMVLLRLHASAGDTGNHITVTLVDERDFKRQTKAIGWAGHNGKRRKDGVCPGVGAIFPGTELKTLANGIRIFLCLNEIGHDKCCCQEHKTACCYPYSIIQIHVSCHVTAPFSFFSAASCLRHSASCRPTPHHAATLVSHAAGRTLRSRAVHVSSGPGRLTFFIAQIHLGAGGPVHKFLCQNVRFSVLALGLRSLDRKIVIHVDGDPFLFPVRSRTRQLMFRVSITAPDFYDNVFLLSRVRQ